ncbi:MAG: hypothetical protein HOO03_10460 [Rhodobacteraceae bacterium]|nr:hypothetical protein [Paracoccaceae bacterium]MBT6271514.1 hypothetical protein [Paracoccaceae bacterium]MBT6437474.1 hypothetical protein [Paracoccaceae bacterium]
MKLYSSGLCYTQRSSSTSVVRPWGRSSLQKSLSPGIDILGGATDV